MTKVLKGKKTPSKAPTRPRQIKKSSVRPEDEEAKATLETIAEIVSNGKCILFLGAAVHYPPPKGSPYSYPLNERPPLGSIFSADLAAKSRFAKRFKGESVTNLQRVSQDYETRKQRSELVKEIKAAVYTDKKPSPVLRALASLNFPLVVTTNYDQLFEKALRDIGKDPIVSSYKKNEDRDEPTADYPYDDDPISQRPFIFKIHGDIIEGPESIVITDEDYIQFILRMSDKQQYYPVPQTIQYHFKKWPTLFIGYSLKDYNLRLLFKTLRWKIDKAGFPATYSVDLYPDPLILDVWQNQRRYVNFIVRDVWNFVPELYRTITGKVMPK